MISSLLLALALVGSPDGARIVQSSQGHALAWDYPDASLTGYTGTNAEGQKFTGAIKHFVVSLNGGASTDVGMSVLALVAGGKTYSTPIPSTITGKFTATVAACVTWNPTTDPAATCGPATVGNFELPPAQNKFTVGQRVQVYSGNAHGAGAAVRGGAGFGHAIISVHAAGTKGTVLAGPTDADGLRWWQIDYDVAPDGWTTEVNIDACVTNCEPMKPPVDCVVSEWSAWSAWKPINATTMERSRTRTVVTEPANGGAGCPSLIETQTLPIPAEVCGDLVDNDFDGQIDEGCTVNACVITPLRVTGVKWPAGQTGNRSGSWNSGNFVLTKVEWLWTPQRVVFTDNRGCSVTVQR